MPFRRAWRASCSRKGAADTHSASTSPMKAAPASRCWAATSAADGASEGGAGTAAAAAMVGPPAQCDMIAMRRR